MLPFYSDLGTGTDFVTQRDSLEMDILAIWEARADELHRRQCLIRFDACVYFVLRAFGRESLLTDCFFFFFSLVFLLFLGPLPRPMEVPRLGVESEL